MDRPFRSENSSPRRRLRYLAVCLAVAALQGCNESATTEPATTSASPSASAASSVSATATPASSPSTSLTSGITAVSGTVQEGGSITLTGNGFGTMDGDVIQFARGDERENGSPIDGASPTQGTTLSTFVIGLGRDLTGEHLRFSNVNPRPGRTSSLRRLRVGATSGVQREGGFGYAGRAPADPKLYISYYRYHAWDAISATENLKQYYVFGNGRGPAGQSQVPQPILHVPSGSQSWAMGANLSGSDPNKYNNMGWRIGNSQRAWQRWESYLVLNTPGVADGKFKVWRDGVLGIASDGFMWQPGTMRVAATGFTDFRLGYMDKSMDGTVIDYSDYYIATTPARVELCDTDRWSTCTHKEIQLTQSVQWSDTAINVQLNQGAFDALQGKYLYVIKSDGSPVSEAGYPL